MDRTYLYVPPEESAAVRIAGAQWDERLKCWYLDPGAELSRFARWLGVDPGAAELSIISDEACVAVATVPCSQCRKPIEVICIHCKSGTAFGEPLTQFTVLDVLTMDDSLARQLAPWPEYRPVAASYGNGPRYANHCLHCGAEQDDRDLHGEPGDPFFDIAHAVRDSLRLIPLAGRVRLSGDEHFTIE